MTDQSSLGDNEKYYDIYENILNVNKNYIQEYIK